MKNSVIINKILTPKKSRKNFVSLSPQVVILESISKGQQKQERCEYRGRACSETQSDEKGSEFANKNILEFKN
jgi:hypothetical protein